MGTGISLVVAADRGWRALGVCAALGCAQVVRCAGPAGEQVERLPGGRAGWGGVGDDGEPGISGDLQGVIAEREVTGDRVVERLDAAAVVLHIVSRPADPEDR